MIDPKKVLKGHYYRHKTKGIIKVFGMKEHCGQHAIFIDHLNNWVYLENCSPIPLEAKHFENRRIYYHPFKSDFTIEFCENLFGSKGMFAYVINAGTIFTQIKTVDELQSIMRFCGLSTDEQIIDCI